MILPSFCPSSLAPNAFNAVRNWSATKFMSRAPGSNGSATTATLSLWLLRSSTGAINGIFSQDSSGSGTLFWARIDASNHVGAFIAGAGTSHYSSGTYGSTSSWYHLVWAINTTLNSASSNRWYVNGAEVAYGDANNYGASAAIKMNQTGNTMWLGTDSTNSIVGKIAHVQWVDGTQCVPSDFSQVGTGGMIPKKYAGSFGTNGWCLDFANTSSLGLDISGNGNNLTLNGGMGSGDSSAENVFY